MASNCFIIIASSINLYPGRIDAMKVYNYRIQQLFWPMNENTKNRKLIKPEDRIVFYMAGKGDNAKHFIATSLVQSGVIQHKYNEPKEWLTVQTQQGIFFKNVKVLDKPVSIDKIKDSLDFIYNKTTLKWGAYLQGGCIHITDQDYMKIVSYGQLKQ